MPINVLPNELLLQIFRCKSEPWQSASRLLPYCLVCRRWREVAQALLFQDITLQKIQNVAMLHECLINSDRLAQHVRYLLLEMNCGWPDPPHAYMHKLSVSSMVAQCLERTKELETFSFVPTASEFVNDLVTNRICALPKLKKLTLPRVVFEEEYGSYNDSEDEDDDYSDDEDILPGPICLLDLPKTIEHLEIDDPSDELLDHLPQICDNLRQPYLPPLAHASTQPASSVEPDHHTNRLFTGLRSLSFDLTHNKSEIESFHQVHAVWLNNRYEKVFAALVLPLSSTLTSFSIHTSSNYAPPSNSILIGFLSGTPLLQKLQLGPIKIGTKFFELIPPLRYLRSLKVDEIDEEDGPAWQQFCSALTDFISHSPFFDTINFGAFFQLSLSVNPLIKSLIKSTTPTGVAHLSRLRYIGLCAMGDPSMEVFEYLLSSTPHLRYLDIDAPVGSISKTIDLISNAMVANLQLDTVEVSNIELHRPLNGQPLNMDQRQSDNLQSLKDRFWVYG